MATSGDLIRVEHVIKEFNHGAVKALNDCSLTIQKGEVVAIIGPSGSGKSTLLRCINLLERPNQGEVRFHGRPITGRGTDASAYRTRVGMVFQSFNLFSNMNVLENCMAGPVKVLHRSREEARARALRYLEQVGMAPYINARPRQLSGGQKQRVAIARALAMEPALLIADEPTSMLDPSGKANLLRMLKGLQNSRGFSMLFITHDLDSALKISDRLFRLEGGTLARLNPNDYIKVRFDGLFDAG